MANGLFTALVDFGPSAFDGNPRWLDIHVRCPAGSGAYTQLAPRQLLSAAPNALSLVPGATISGTLGNELTVVASATIIGNPTAIHGIADGTANLFPAVPVAVWGESHTGLGVLGVSDQLIGVSGYSHAATGDGVYASNAYGGKAVEASATTGDGVYGTNSASSPTVAAVHGVNTGGGYGVIGESSNIAVYAHNTMTSTVAYLGAPCCAGDFYGTVAIHGNLSVTGDLAFTGNLTGGNKAGYLSDIALNAGSQPLSAGDLVVVVGSTNPIVGDIPVARVVKATSAYQTGVIGVVDQHVTKSDSVHYAHEPIAPGEYLNVVTLGMFRAVKADAAFGGIHVGDLLVASDHAGYAMKATDRLRAVGAIIGKALGDLASSSGVLPVIVTLQ